MNADEITGIVDRHGADPGGLIAILQDIQARYSYLPADALRIVAQQTGRSLVDIYGVATFYRAFSLQPRGKHLLSVCLGTACHVRGGPVIAAEFERELGVKPGGTTPDREFTFETVNCLGACALGPIVVVDGHYFSNVAPVKVKQIVEQVRAGLDELETQTDERVFPLTASCPRCRHSLMETSHTIDGQPAIRITAANGNGHGWLRLSSLYGSYVVEAEHDVAPDAVVHLFCPHCNVELTAAVPCPVCNAPLVLLSVGTESMVQICSRRGCRYHLLDLVREPV
jgi:NADH:ubiquinone oxidoreductase subunit E